MQTRFILASESKFYEFATVYQWVRFELLTDPSKTLKIFKHPQDFLRNINKISKNTVIFLDSNFNDCKGETFINEIYDSGFKHIYLCTGFASDNFKANQYLLGIKGKEPFWEKK